MVPLTLASMVPNTVTPLPDDVLEVLDVPPADPVPAQPDTSTPIAMAKTAAMIDFKEDSRGRWDCGHYRPQPFSAL